MQKFERGINPKDAMEIGDIKNRKEIKEHLTFIYDRMILKHGEKAAYDYMIRFKQIINKL